MLNGRWPLVIFSALVLLLGIGLTLNPREVPSPLIGQPAPVMQFTPQVREALQGKVWLLNVWASWCTTCRAEHGELMAFAQASGVPLVGLSYKDDPVESAAYLAKVGSPYAYQLHDFQGRIGMDWGVYATPETFLVDAQGVVRFKQIGPVTLAQLQDWLGKVQ
jgi:cytochrome c biogenesis protein CcmG/thiol:disulfide interchange protein DsbE